MTPEEQQKIKINLQEIAEILYKNTPVDNLQSFEGSIPIVYKAFFPSASLICREKIFIDLATRGRSLAGYLSSDAT